MYLKNKKTKQNKERQGIAKRHRGEDERLKKEERKTKLKFFSSLEVV